jgi:hypothetical protein
MKRLAFFLALLLVFPATFADDSSDRCQPVNAVWYLTDYLVGPDNCDGYDYCIPGSLTGTPNGEMTFFGNVSDEIWDPFNTGYSINLGLGEERIWTQHGAIYSLTHAIFDFDTAVWTELLIVTGGTGKYESATGRMVFHNKLPPSPGKPISFDGPISLVGLICTP